MAEEIKEPQVVTGKSTEEVKSLLERLSPTTKSIQQALRIARKYDKNTQVIEKKEFLELHEQGTLSPGLYLIAENKKPLGFFRVPKPFYIPKGATSPTQGEVTLEDKILKIVQTGKRVPIDMLMGILILQGEKEEKIVDYNLYVNHPEYPKVCIWMFISHKLSDAIDNLLSKGKIVLYLVPPESYSDVWRDAVKNKAKVKTLKGIKDMNDPKIKEVKELSWLPVALGMPEYEGVGG